MIEKYQALGRDALTLGDRVAAENFFQHAEHYYRVMAANGGADQRGGRNSGVQQNRQAVGEEQQPRIQDPQLAKEADVEKPVHAEVASGAAIEKEPKGKGEESLRGEYEGESVRDRERV